MPALNSFDYALIRIVPRVERGEFINAGVIVFCLSQKFLAARILFDEGRIRSLWPEADLETICDHLSAFPEICEGNPNAGPIAQLSQRERFHWLVAPRSTVLQISPVHSGLCQTPADALEELCRKLVMT